MNIVVRNKVINVFLLFSMLSHVTFLHNYFDNYILCYGADGRIAIENANDFSECEGVKIFDKEVRPNNTGATTVDNTDCEDVSLDENCFEENQFLSKNKIVIPDYILKTNQLVLPSENEVNSFHQIDFNLTDNTILENYTTVSLLI
ncbi:MAG: hypothetical protein ABIJ40_11380 [Bacteroidota bacterium]